MNNLKNLQLQRKFKLLFNRLSQLEDLMIGNKEINYLNFDKKCIFVSGMPRSGTTILTHIISNFNDVGSFNYSDLPFTKIPFIWSKINWLYYFKNKSSERIHGDGLKINLLSPDAFEELIWSENLPNYENENFSAILDSNYENKELEKELVRSINKILLIRKKKIYLSKGNYNIFRIKYINKILKNSLFLICIRNPVDVIQSSIRVHKKFLEIGEGNNKFTDEMNELCHFEFGKNRKDPFKNKETMKDRYGHDSLKDTDRGFGKREFKGKSPLATSKASTVVAREGMLDQLKQKFPKKQQSMLSEENIIKE